jgi:signal transduction histidine kinase
VTAADPFIVEVLDDGIGFDPAAVPETRLGIAVSMVARMRAIPGGNAMVVSAPGVGTRVAISWRTS